MGGGNLSFRDLKSLIKLSGIDKLYPKNDESFIYDLLNIKTNSAFLIKNEGFWDISHLYETFEILSVAIINHKQIGFAYKDKDRVVNPYKLVSNKGIWYLLADENSIMKNFTLTSITNLKLTKKSFSPNVQFLKRIDSNDTNWFSNTSFEVKLLVSGKAVEYFLYKDILSNKCIHKRSKDSIEISTKVAYDDEILNIVKAWIPHIRILSPAHLQDKLNKILIDYVKTTNPVAEICDNTTRGNTNKT